MTDDWLALSDRSNEGPMPDLLGAGQFLVEFALPLDGAVVLLDHQDNTGWPRTFALFHDPEAGLVLLHRQGRSVQRHVLPGRLPETLGTGRLTFGFDAPARRWDMRFELLGSADFTPLVAQGDNPLPLRPADIRALSHPPHRLRQHRAVLWFGLTRGFSLPARAPWIGQRTPVETDRGPVAAGHLRPGDMIWTIDDGFMPLRALQRFELPACGSFAPVLLRAPFFGAEHDLLISADQHVALEGAEVEYLFGEDEVLVPAGAMVDGRTALSEQRRSVAGSVALVFDLPALIAADGCILLADTQTDTSPRRKLEPYEVLTLMALMGRSGHRRVA